MAVHQVPTCASTLNRQAAHPSMMSGITLVLYATDVEGQLAHVPTIPVHRAVGQWLGAPVDPVAGYVGILQLPMSKE